MGVGRMGCVGAEGFTRVLREGLDEVSLRTSAYLNIVVLRDH